MGLCHLEAHILTQESQSGNNFSAFYGKCRGKDLYLLTSALIYITGCKPFALYILSEEFAFFYNTESIADLCISCSQQKKRMQGAEGSLSALCGWRLQQFRSQVFIPGVKSSDKCHSGENLLHPFLLRLARFLWTSSCALQCYQRNEYFGDSSGTSTHAHKKGSFWDPFGIWIIQLLFSLDCLQFQFRRHIKWLGYKGMGNDASLCLQMLRDVISPSPSPWSSASPENQ